MLFLSFTGLSIHGSVVAANLPWRSPDSTTTLVTPSPIKNTFSPLTVPNSSLFTIERPVGINQTSSPKNGVDVPFYSQFKDISSPSWQKVGCGIASLAMLIDYYSDETSVDVDALLQSGIKHGAYAADAGWSHAGLIALAESYGLTGASHSLAHLSATDAFSELTKVLHGGPVMVSVHYTFEPTNPIPHLVVVNKVIEDKIYYNDPADSTGNRSISIEKFKRAWKQRYIDIRPL